MVDTAADWGQDVSHSRPSVGQARYLEQAACRPHPTRWWFSDSAESVEAYVICTNCAVRDQCLSFVLDHPDLVGIWAATTTEERVRLRRTRRHPSQGAQFRRDDAADR